MVLNVVKMVVKKQQRKLIPRRMFTSQSKDKFGPWFTKRVKPQNVLKKQVEQKSKPPSKPVVQVHKELDLKELARKINNYPFSPEAQQFFKLIRPEIVGSYAPKPAHLGRSKYSVDPSPADKTIATSEEITKPNPAKFSSYYSPSTTTTPSATSVNKPSPIPSSSPSTPPPIPLRDAGIGGVVPLKESVFSGRTTVNVKSFADAAKLASSGLEDEIKPTTKQWKKMQEVIKMKTIPEIEPDPQTTIVPKKIRLAKNFTKTTSISTVEIQKEIQIPLTVAIEKIEKVKTKEDDPITVPTRDQLKIEVLRASIPFIGFGFFQNLVLIYGGDVIETAFGNHFGITLMAAAACGNAVANATGALTGKFIASNFKNLPQSNLNAGQKARFSTKFAKSFGAAIGVIIGCLLGMIPLLLTDEKLEGMRRMFNRADKNKDGKISRVEMDYFFTAIGMEVSLEKIDEFVWKNDNDYDGQLNFEECVQIVELLETGVAV